MARLGLKKEPESPARVTGFAEVRGEGEVESARFLLTGTDSEDGFYLKASRVDGSIEYTVNSQVGTERVVEKDGRLFYHISGSENAHLILKTPEEQMAESHNGTVNVEVMNQADLAERRPKSTQLDPTTSKSAESVRALSCPSCGGPTEVGACGYCGNENIVVVEGATVAGPNHLGWVVTKG